MKYEEILKNALAGKRVRPHNYHEWSTLHADGYWYAENNKHFNMSIGCMQLDTWEVEPQKLYCWGYLNEFGLSITLNDPSNPLYDKYELVKVKDPE